MWVEAQDKPYSRLTTCLTVLTITLNASSHSHPLQCIAAGSHIANHELESAELRPFATHLSKVITKVRQALRLQSYVNRVEYPSKVSCVWAHWLVAASCGIFNCAIAIK